MTGYEKQNSQVTITKLLNIAPMEHTCSCRDCIYIRIIIIHHHTYFIQNCTNDGGQLCLKGALRVSYSIITLSKSKVFVAGP